MEWQAVVLAVQILLLAIGWVLFQRARGELSARAAETPILTEIKALQNNVKKLLAELEQTADEKDELLEQRCEDARALLEILDIRLAETEELVLRIETTSDQYHDKMRSNAEDHLHLADRPISLRLASNSIVHTETETREGNDLHLVNNSGNRNSAHQQLRRLVFKLADAGEAPAAIARATQLSEGEVETLLGLRLQRK